MKESLVSVKITCGDVLLCQSVITRAELPEIIRTYTEGRTDVSVTVLEV